MLQPSWACTASPPPCQLPYHFPHEQTNERGNNETYLSSDRNILQPIQKFNVLQHYLWMAFFINKPKTIKNFINYECWNNIFDCNLEWKVYGRYRFDVRILIKIQHTNVRGFFVGFFRWLRETATNMTHGEWFMEFEYRH